MPPDTITELADALATMKRMRQLNIELLEQLNVSCTWLLENKVQIPNSSTFASLLTKVTTLLDEMNADEPKIMQYSISRRKVTDFRTDEEGTEPK